MKELLKLVCTNCNHNIVVEDLKLKILKCPNGCCIGTEEELISSKPGIPSRAVWVSKDKEK
jgi:hypothetical protein